MPLLTTKPPALKLPGRGTPSGTKGVAAGRAVVPVLLVFILLGLPGAIAAGEIPLEGDVEYAAATASGSSTSQMDTIGALRLAPSADSRGHWRLDASFLRVEWVRYNTETVGTSPGGNDSLVRIRDDKDQGGHNYTNATVAGDHTRAEGSFLLVPSSSRRGATTLAVDGVVGAAASTGESWAVGALPSGAVSTYERNGTAYQDHWVPAGAPMLSTNSPLQGQATGDFTLYLWGTSITVSSPSGADATYDSGSWTENTTGGDLDPRGIKRTEVIQLLILRAQGASWTWVLKEGDAQWTAASAHLSTRGRVWFTGASGGFALGESAYSPRAASFGLEGRIDQVISASASGKRRLVSTLDGEAAPQGIEASAAVPAPPASGAWAFLWPGTVLLAVLVAAAVYAVHRWRVSRRPIPQELGRIEFDLIRGRFGAARRGLNRILKRAPQSTEAWKLYGTLLLQTGQLQTLVERIVPRLASIKEDREELAYQVALAFMELGREGDAIEWIKRASEKPSLCQAIRKEPAFSRFQGQAWFVQLVMSEPNPAYG